MLIAIYNDFHNSSADMHITVGVPLSKGQVRRARKTLCGVEKCCCGDDSLGRRGPQSCLITFEITAEGGLVPSTR